MMAMCANIVVVFGHVFVAIYHLLPKFRVVSWLINQTSMKTVFILRGVAMVLALIGVISCEDDLDQPVPDGNSILQFDVGQLQLQENGTEQVVSLSLNKPAGREGVLDIELDTISSRLKTDVTLVGRKMQVSIVRGQQKLNIKILPSDNQLVDGDMEVILTLTSATPGFIIGGQKTLSVTLLDDDQGQEPVQSAVSFTSASSLIRENAAEGYDVVIEFSKPFAGEGSFEIEIGSSDAHNLNYITHPEAAGGRISITPEIGSTSASVRIIPVDNAIISGETSISLSISNTFGSIVKGGQVFHQLLIADDELAGLPKGYSIGGALGMKRTYDYDASGRISKVLVESGNTSHTETYFYDASGRIERINSYPEMNSIFIWTDGRITRSERIEFGVLKKYTEYDYDAQGNVSGTANYFRQPNGEYELSFMVTYLYFADNNLYKAMYYLPVQGQDEFTLHSTRTYDNYLAVDNDFPMVDILPGVKTQNKLPGTFRIEENGQNLFYNLEYQFFENGRVSRRNAHNGSMVETTDYFYY